MINDTKHYEMNWLVLVLVLYKYCDGEWMEYDDKW